MKKQSLANDAYGHQLYDYYRGQNDGLETVERDDGFIQPNFGPKTYLSEYRNWSEHEKAAMVYARGRVLDIGCGGGRHSLYLQRKGHAVVGIDTSPLAIKVAKLRGMKDTRIKSITQLDKEMGKFDTILMLGNNFGLFANPRQAKKLLKKFLRITNPKATIIAESLDPHKTKNPDHLQYHKLNEKRGRWPGQVRIRIRYMRHTGPWFDYLLVSKKEMKEIIDGTAWEIRRFISSKSRSGSGYRRGGPYIAIICRVI